MKQLVEIRLLELQHCIDTAAHYLQQCPDLNLKDYSRNQVKLLVYNTAFAWAELTKGKYPDSVRYTEEEQYFGNT